jgi:hypothetical protein
LKNPEVGDFVSWYADYDGEVLTGRVLAMTEYECAISTADGLVVWKILDSVW